MLDCFVSGHERDNPSTIALPHHNSITENNVASPMLRRQSKLVNWEDDSPKTGIDVSHHGLGQNSINALVSDGQQVVSSTLNFTLLPTSIL